MRLKNILAIFFCGLMLFLGVEYTDLSVIAKEDGVDESLNIEKEEIIYKKESYKKIKSKKVYMYDETNLVELYEYVDGKIIQMTSFDNDGGINFYLKYDYSDDGILLKETKYDVEGIISSWIIYDYDGNNIKQTYYNCDGYIYEQKEFDVNGKDISHMFYHNNVLFQSWIYDQYGNLAMKVTYKDDGSILQINNKIEYEYNDKGIVTKKTEYTNDGNNKEIITYNESGDLTERINNEGRIVEKCDNEYDTNGKKIKSTYYDSDENVKYMNTYEYDCNGNMIISKMYSSNGDIGEVREYRYDEKGNVTNYEWYWYEPDRKKYASFETEYDLDGDLIKEVVDDKIITIYEYDKKENTETDILDDNNQDETNTPKATDTTELPEIQDTIVEPSTTETSDISEKTDKPEVNDTSETPDVSDISDTIEPSIVAKGTLTAEGIYCAQDKPSIIAAFLTEKSEASDTIEYRWLACEENEPTVWFEVSPWTKDNYYLSWTPDKNGNYIIVAQARLVGG